MWLESTPVYLAVVSILSQVIKHTKWQSVQVRIIPGNRFVEVRLIYFVDQYYT